jgi:hypothetical protein
MDTLFRGICECGYNGILKFNRFCPKCHKQVKFKSANEIKGTVVKTKRGIEIRGEKNEPKRAVDKRQ